LLQPASDLSEELPGNGISRGFMPIDHPRDFGDDTFDHRRPVNLTRALFWSGFPTSVDQRSALIAGSARMSAGDGLAGPFRVANIRRIDRAMANGLAVVEEVRNNVRGGCFVNPRWCTDIAHAHRLRQAIVSRRR
jgi:hypothetical protein